MSFELAFRRQADAELEQAVHWYREISPALGERFAQTVNQALKQILANPHRYSFSAPSMRRCKLKKFPYNIHYVVEDSTITVVAVFHSNRDQGPLRDRL